MNKKTWIPVATATFVLAMLAPTAAALQADDPPSHETRVLHDHEEDPAIILAGKHGHDIIALDVRELWDPFYGEPMMVFTLTLDGGCNPLVLDPCADLREVISFTIAGTEKTVEFHTDDNVTWTGDMDRYTGAMPANGTAFAVEGWMRFSRLGLAPGQEATGWTVQGYAGETPADKMPEGLFPGFPDPLDVAYDVGSYTIRFPDYYGSLEYASDSVDLSSNPDVKTVVKLSVHNPLESAQDFDLDTLALTGVKARFIDPADSSEDVSLTVTVPANDTVEIEMALYGQQAGAGGDLTVRALTEMGGIAFDSIRVDVDQQPSTVTQTATSTATSTVTSTVTQTQSQDPESEDPDSDESEDSPGVGLVLGAVALLGLAAVVARRRL